METVFMSAFVDELEKFAKGPVSGFLSKVYKKAPKKNDGLRKAFADRLREARTDVRGMSKRTKGQMDSKTVTFGVGGEGLKSKYKDPTLYMDVRAKGRAKNISVS